MYIYRSILVESGYAISVFGLMSNYIGYVFSAQSIMVYCPLCSPFSLLCFMSFFINLRIGQVDIVKPF